MTDREKQETMELISDTITLLKEQVAVVRCKDCKHRGNSEKCVLSAISEEKDFPLFMLDNVVIGSVLMVKGR